jgi:two-component system, NarL family, nitrate/nitrite response regulator NarL
LIRVHIETASAVTRAGLEAILRAQGEIEVVDSAAGADVLVREEVPDAGDAAARVPLVVLADDVPAWEALRSGVRAVLHQDAPPEQIIAAIFAAAAGLAVVPSDESLVALPNGRLEQPVEPLTPREMDVIEMLAEGLSNKMIAHRLEISEHTAKFHVNSILAKLHAGTRTEAVMRGIRLGLVKI